MVEKLRAPAAICKGLAIRRKAEDLQYEKHSELIDRSPAVVWRDEHILLRATGSDAANVFILAYRTQLFNATDIAIELRRLFWRTAGTGFLNCQTRASC